MIYVADMQTLLFVALCCSKNCLKERDGEENLKMNLRLELPDWLIGLNPLVLVCAGYLVLKLDEKWMEVSWSNKYMVKKASKTPQ
jgi:hypothetical protein